MSEREGDGMGCLDGGGRDRSSKLLPTSSSPISRVDRVRFSVWIRSTEVGISIPSCV